MKNKLRLPEFVRRLLCFHPKQSVYHHTLYCGRCDLYFDD